MHTDNIPRKEALRSEYYRSDGMRMIELPPAVPARTYALHIKEALAQGDAKALQSACKSLLETFSESFGVKSPSIRILSVRPREVTDKYTLETFGDYTPETARIRLWMRTAIQKKPTSYGTLLSTLCHEFCHHLDMVLLDLPNTFHTRGFYERSGLLYHHVQGTPVRPIVWIKQANGTFTVDWAKTMRGGR
jgi:hypothetical protein